MDRQELERAVLGDMILGQPHASQSFLSERDFQDQALRECFRAVLDLRRKGIASPGILVLRAWLGERGKAIPDTELADVYIAGSVPGNAKAKVGLLKREAAKGRLKETGRSLVEADELDAEILERVRREVDMAKEVTARDDVDTLADMVRNVKAEKEMPDPRQVGTGISDIDRYGLMRRGSLTVVAAETSHGKTALACSFVAYWIATGRGVVYCAAEEQPIDIVERVGRMLPDPGVDLLTEAKLHIRPARRVAHVADALSDCPFEPEIVVVDHLHEFHSERVRQSQVLELGDIMRDLRGVAQSANVPLLILAQLNREASKSGEKPKLHHLRGSGEIEQLADKVWLLSRKGAEASLIVAKNRRGPRGDEVALAFDAERVMFRSAWQGSHADYRHD